MSKQNKSELNKWKYKRAQEELKKANEITSPKKTSLILMFFWLLVEVALILLLNFTRKTDIFKIDNIINTASAIFIGIGILWIIVLRLSMFDGIFRAFKNFRNKSLIKAYEIEVPKLTREEFGERQRKKSLLGSVILIGINVLICIITLMTIYL